MCIHSCPCLAEEKGPECHLNSHGLGLSSAACLNLSAARHSCPHSLLASCRYPSASRVTENMTYGIATPKPLTPHTFPEKVTPSPTFPDSTQPQTRPP